MMYIPKTNSFSWRQYLEWKSLTSIMQIISICIMFIFLVFFKAIAVKLFLCNDADVFVKGAQRGLVLNFLAEFYNSFFVWTYRLALHSCSEPCFFLIICR